MTSGRGKGTSRGDSCAEALGRAAGALGPPAKCLVRVHPVRGREKAGGGEANGSWAWGGPDAMQGTLGSTLRPLGGH